MLKRRVKSENFPALKNVSKSTFVNLISCNNHVILTAGPHAKMSTRSLWTEIVEEIGWYFRYKLEL